MGLYWTEDGNNNHGNTNAKDEGDVRLSGCRLWIRYAGDGIHLVEKRSESMQWWCFCDSFFFGPVVLATRPLYVQNKSNDV